MAFDTSGKWLTVALGLNGDIVFLQSLSKTRQSDTLVKELDSLMRSSGTSISEINLIGCVIGPGNFTGLRSGIAVAKAISFSLSIPIIGLKYFECFKSDDPVTLIRKARKNWWYVSEFNGKKWSSDLIPTEALYQLKGKIVSEEKIEGFSFYINEGPLISGYSLLQSTIESFERSERIYDHVSVKPFYLQKPVAQQMIEEKR